MQKTKTMKKLYLYLFLIALVYTSSQAQCTATVTISGIYNTLYTGSNSWIASSGVTTIPSGSDVTLDANPATDGYVTLDPGFETQPNTTFLAVVQTPCPLLGINENEIENRFSMYPNPVFNSLSVEAQDIITKIDVVDSNGRVILSQKENSNSSRVNFETVASGIYFIKLFSNKNTVTKKIIKR